MLDRKTGRDNLIALLKGLDCPCGFSLEMEKQKFLYLL